MKKIVLICLILSIFLISGCVRVYTSPEESSKKSTQMTSTEGDVEQDMGVYEEVRSQLNKDCYVYKTLTAIGKWGEDGEAKETYGWEEYGGKCNTIKDCVNGFENFGVPSDYIKELEEKSYIKCE